MTLTTWILIVLVHVGAMGGGNSNSLTSVPGFESKTACEAAGEASKALVKGTLKELVWVCVRSK